MTGDRSVGGTVTVCDVYCGVIGDRSVGGTKTVWGVL